MAKGQDVADLVGTGHDREVLEGARGALNLTGTHGDQVAVTEVKAGGAEKGGLQTDGDSHVYHVGDDLVRVQDCEVCVCTRFSREKKSNAKCAPFSLFFHPQDLKKISLTAYCLLPLLPPRF